MTIPQRARSWGIPMTGRRSTSPIQDPGHSGEVGRRQVKWNPTWLLDDDMGTY